MEVWGPCVSFPVKGAWDVQLPSVCPRVLLEPKESHLGQSQPHLQIRLGVLSGSDV